MYHKYFYGNCAYNIGSLQVCDSFAALLLPGHLHLDTL